MPPIDGKDPVYAPGLFFEVAAAGEKHEKRAFLRKTQKKSQPLQRCYGIRAFDLLNRKPTERTLKDFDAGAVGSLVINRTT